MRIRNVDAFAHDLRASVDRQPQQHPLVRTCAMVGYVFRHPRSQRDIDTLNALLDQAAAGDIELDVADRGAVVSVIAYTPCRRLSRPTLS